MFGTIVDDNLGSPNFLICVRHTLLPGRSTKHDADHRMRLPNSPICLATIPSP